MKSDDIYFDQKKLSKVNELLCDNIDSLLEHLGVDFSHQGKMIVCACPVHNGDNTSAFNLYTEELSNGLRGNWKCRTQGCEKKFGNNILAFLRGTLELSWKDTVGWACNFLGVNYVNFKGVSSSELEKRQYITGINSLSNKPKEENRGVTRDIIISKLTIPCSYYLKRGYSKDILSRYDVGLCEDRNKKMYGRAVVPIYNAHYEYAVGFTARSINENYNYKWIHSTGFQASHYLYNYWFAKEHILTSGVVILVEGPGDVWKLEQSGIHTSLAMFGTDLSDQQLSLLYSCGANSIIILTDSDEAGRMSSKKIEDKCKRLFRIFSPTLSSADVGDMSEKNIKQEIVPIIKKAMEVNV